MQDAQPAPTWKPQARFKLKGAADSGWVLGPSIDGDTGRPFPGLLRVIYDGESEPSGVRAQDIERGI